MSAEAIAIGHILAVPVTACTVCIDRSLMDCGGILYSINMSSHLLLNLTVLR